MTEDAVVIASYARTPIGGFQGDLAGLKATQLGASAVRAAVERAGVDGEAIEKIFMGCVLRSEEHTSELQSLMRISYAVFCLKKKKLRKTKIKSNFNISRQ